MPNAHSVAVALAGMLLLQNSQITLQEIEALPFVDNKMQALAIARKLALAFGEHYRVEITSDSRSGGTHLRLRRLDAELVAPV